MYNFLTLYFSLLYGCETWTIYRRHEKLMQQFHLRCLRSILHIRWQDMVPDTEVLERAGLPSVITTMHKPHTRWEGHVSRMPDSRIPKQFYGELRHGKRSVGCPRKSHKDTVKVYLKDFAIDTNNWQLSATDRTAWRGLIAKGAQHSESRRTDSAKEKRRTRKARTQGTADTTPTHRCQTCRRGFYARIGLISHLLTHRFVT